MRYDVAIIGNDEAAVQVARTCVANGLQVGCFLPARHHSSWIMSRALQALVGELLVDMTSKRQRFLTARRSPGLLKRLLTKAVAAEVTRVADGLKEIGCEVSISDPLFVDERTLELVVRETALPIRSRYTVIATGVRYDVMQSDFGRKCFRPPMSLFRGQRLPHRLCVLGGGDFGAAVAALMSLFGIHTRLVARRDPESVFLELAYSAGVHIGHHPSEVGLTSDVQMLEEELTVVDCRRVIGFTDHLHLQATGIEPDENGQLWCAGNFETWCSGVFGVGEVVGFSSESALHPVIQAERVLERIRPSIPKPHLLEKVRSQSLT